MQKTVNSLEVTIRWNEEKQVLIHLVHVAPNIRGQIFS